MIGSALCWGDRLGVLRRGYFRPELNVWVLIKRATIAKWLFFGNSTMESINAREAKNGFGDVLLKAQSAPVGINKNGKPVAVVISADHYSKIEALREELLNRELQKGLAAIAEGRVRDGENVVHELRARYFDGNS